jgi:probable F420-dependent oxidoreductase
MVDIGRIGIWTFHFERQPAARMREAAAEIEDLGYGALWFPEAIGREALSQAALLLDATRRIVVATGIANIWARDAMTMAAGQKTLCEAHPGRFLLGIGVSHAPFVAGLRGLDYSKPVATMSAYLDAMASSPYASMQPSEPAPTLLAALGPKMLALAAERTDGAHTYWCTPEHTARARGILGPGKLLCVEQKVVLTDDPSEGRAAALGALALYVDLPNYRNNWVRLGFTDEEIDGRADRFVDAVVAWGDERAVGDRIREHLDAGADHVCIQPLSSASPFLPHEPALEALAPGRSVP